ncbi:cytochrome-c oxidase, cbb3-type subunit III [Rhodobacter veldkampii DSM 11550]|uniref:Cbb3-type cytochrome c oxidase subunit n=1 Tax=Phaeovulum veldkampii DSM 11550 TaxID=1185920 RepID=A0A2T4JJV1_9RHOB|nr:cytochrome-c oxidase, cbb3-type subunit III [Phaeovulum veldkampii]MBK5946076.1 cytochrome-c oxidase, cbb3-type subunit III [Phaeovulum veldkampii DSM 11550]NCU20385.1 cytochrome-c oxidase, cbb3-type subunit III [Candidatus Falkowbacteria bacterium]PTE18176.1 cytochrome-c oxidase, cbb3-type subunit III [Phaeovulum veldkampii DSM 11550]TDQ63524.1 cytochrome c oxidase cbb3-type subunit 3 [Phaeovulum veldkampii DSM 11550]
MSKKPVKSPKKEVQTTGHSWDGIEEYNNPLPRWWLWTFYICVIWGVGYSVLYPAWPLINGATPGLLGHSTRADVAADIARFEAANAPIVEKLVSTELTEIANDPELINYTRNAGAAVFRTWCVQCHGSGAAGNPGGYPNLLDNDWLWGGDVETIHTTITHGIRNTDDPDARYSAMPAFGRDELLEPAQIAQVVQHVRAISGQEHDAALAADGAVVFEENCASCHMEDGTGDRTQGAPNLTDAIWLYGGDVATLTETVTNARFGVMPNWGGEFGRLTEAEVRAVALYVHSLGGGE